MHPVSRIRGQDRLADRLRQALHRQILDEMGRRPVFPALEPPLDPRAASAVLVLLGRMPPGRTACGEPGLILNKRSPVVRQAGDLCCPGGHLMPRADRLLSAMLPLPFMPLGRWPLWRRWRRDWPRQARLLSLLLATGLREGMEEMRLNPLRVEFLGPLPPYRLRLFQREIHPLVGWVRGRQRFRPNREVARIVYLPLSRLLEPANYFRYHLRMPEPALPGQPAGSVTRQLPCFRLRDRDGEEILWGATYHITMALLERGFGFRPPPLSERPVVSGRLDGAYLTGP